MKTKQEILKKYWDAFEMSIGGKGDQMSDKAIEYFTRAMHEYGEQEYKRGIEDGKTIAEHGTVNWIE